MTPLEIDILLWYATRAVDYRDGDFTAPAVREAIDSFRDDLGLIEPLEVDARGSGELQSYRLTARGRAYVDALTSLPLPICRWVMLDVAP